MYSFRSSFIVLASVALGLAAVGCSTEVAESNASGEQAQTVAPSGSNEDLEAFDRLEPLKKLETLYSFDDSTWASVRDAYVEVPIRILDTLSGDEQRKALDAYYELREFADAQGGDTPKVVAVQLNGVTYGFSISTSGRSWGNWGRLRIYDRKFDEIGSFGYED